jgi:hypothetical protein
MFVGWKAMQGEGSPSNREVQAASLEAAEAALHLC